MMKTCNKGYRVMVELQKEELLYDIKNTAYIYADSISSGIEDKHLLHNIYDVCEEGNRDKMARIMDSAVEDCRECLYRYTKMEMRGGGFDSDEWEECVGSPTHEDDAYCLAMDVPMGFSKSSIHTMTVYVHDYIVNRCMYEWMMLVYPSGAENFLAISEEKKEKIKEAGNRSASHVRIRLHPF